jgi:lia operon protein LiaG
MMLLGLVTLGAAVADSKVGAWLRDPGPAAVSAPVDGIDRVSVRANTGLIRIATADRPDLGVTLNGGNPGTVKVDFVRQGSELQVRLSSPWWHSPYFSEMTAVEVWLPQSLALSALDVNVRTGKVEVYQVSAERLIYNGQTGVFAAMGVQAKEADLRLITGKVELTHHTGGLRASLTKGELLAQFDVLSGPVDVDQTTGQLSLDLPADADAALDALVSRGSLSSSLPLDVTSAAGRVPLRGILGAGTHGVNLRVGTGSIIIRQQPGQ